MDEPQDLPVAPLRRLARGLLFDASHAEDVVQDAWLAALRRRSAPANLVGWLARVVRSRAMDVRRDEARRDAREQRAARPEAQPSSAELSAQLELLRRLLDAVDRLDEPYRAAIGLRFFDDLPPRAIAKRLGLPVNTVRTHVRRGLEKLRKELDPGDERGRDTLLAALAPFAGKLPWTSALARPSASAPLVSAKLALAGLGVVLAGGAWLALRGTQGAESRTSDVLSASASVALATPATDPADAQPNAAQGKREPAAPSRSAMTASWVVRGHVTRGLHDAYPNARLVGRAYAGLRLDGALLLEQQLTADEHGDFAWALDHPRTTSRCSSSRRCRRACRRPLRPLRTGDPAPEAWVVHSFPLDGHASSTVRDRAGHPIPDVRVVHPYPEPREVRTDSTGGFTLAVSSLTGHDELWLDAPGFAFAKIELGTLRAGRRAHAGHRARAGTRGARPRARRVRRARGRRPRRVCGSFPYDHIAATSDASGAFELQSLARIDTPNLAVTRRASPCSCAR
jgi:RNA polymerase sigma-70 factor (ECF subfamily)